MDICRVSILTHVADSKVSKAVCLTCSAIVGISLGYFMKDGIKEEIRKLLVPKITTHQKPLVDESFNLTEANFRYTFNDLTKIRKTKRPVFSPEIWIGSLPWRIMLRPTNLCLESHVICSEIYCSWSCCIHLEFRLLGKTPRILAVDEELYEADSQNEYNLNLGQNIPWEELLDPGNKYVYEDSITFQVILKVEILEKISWSDRLYLTDEKANSLVKKYKTNVDMLRLRIKQLSKQNKQLEKDLRLSKMYKNSHFL